MEKEIILIANYEGFTKALSLISVFLKENFNLEKDELILKLLAYMTNIITNNDYVIELSKFNSNNSINLN